MIEFTLGKGTDDERVYRIISLFEEGETSITVREMLKRAKQLRAHFEKEDQQYFLNYYREIPSEHRGRFHFLSIDECPFDDPDQAVYIFRMNDLWLLYEYSFDHLFWKNNIFLLSLQARLQRISLDE